MMNQSIIAFGLLAASFALGCSSDSGGTGGTGGGTSASTCKLGMDTTRASTSPADACCLLCVKEDPCNAGSTLDDCAAPGGYKHCDELPAAPPACSAAIKAYYDCLLKEADVCMPGPSCDALAEASIAPCNP